MAKNNNRDDSPYRISRPMLWLQFLSRFFAHPLVDIFFFILNRSKAIGLENLPEEDGVLIASNHISGVDTVLIPTFAARRFKVEPFMAPGKEELFRIPVVGAIIRLWGSFPVKRRARDVESMRRISYYCSKYRVMIFPEGTRSKTGELGRGRAGAGWVIYMARPKVVPTLVINTDKFFWPGRPRPWFGMPYTVVFGEPLDLGKYYDMPDNKETSQALIDEVMAAIAVLKEKHRDLYI